MTTTKQKQEQFMEMLKPVQPNLERFVLALVRDTETARDITAETIMIAFQRFETLRNSQAFLSFLFTIAVRVHRKQNNKAKRTQSIDQATVVDLLASGTPPDVAADIENLYRGLQALPAKQREAVVLFEITGLSMKEICEVQGGSLTAVKVRISRGRKKLAKVLGVDQTTQESREVEAQDKSNQEMNIETKQLYSIGISS